MSSIGLRPRRKIRLFWVMLFAFLLVIATSICGMLVFFRLAVMREWYGDSYKSEVYLRRQTYADLMRNYYVAHGHSWEGIHEFLEPLLPHGRPDVPDFTLLDNDGMVIASTTRPEMVDRPFLSSRHRTDDDDSERDRIPLLVDGHQVGQLFIHEWNISTARPGKDGHPPPANVIQSLLLGVAVAGGGLAIALAGLATLFTRRLTHPLRTLTVAAQTLASGNLDVQVPGAHVREMNDLADAFNRMAQALADADRQRRQMTADIAHELRTPLSIMKGRLEGLQDGVYEATPEQLERLMGEALLLERLIEDLRILALAEAGQLPLYPDIEDPRILLEGCRSAFVEQATMQGIRLEVAAEDELALVSVDIQRMMQVLANIMSNALRYMPSGGIITLRGYNDEATEMVCLSISDTGPGIAPEDVPYIFERFWRVDRSRTRERGGSGLGLAIARQIVTAHGGTISATSELGVGTTITICLPYAEDDPESPSSIAV